MRENFPPHHLIARGHGHRETICARVQYCTYPTIQVIMMRDDITVLIQTRWCGAIIVAGEGDARDILRVGFFQCIAECITCAAEWVQWNCQGWDDSCYFVSLHKSVGLHERVCGCILYSRLKACNQLTGKAQSIECI